MVKIHGLIYDVCIYNWKLDTRNINTINAVMRAKTRKITMLYISSGNMIFLLYSHFTGPKPSLLFPVDSYLLISEYFVLLLKCVTMFLLSEKIFIYMKILRFANCDEVMVKVEIDFWAILSRTSWLPLLCSLPSWEEQDADWKAGESKD